MNIFLSLLLGTLTCLVVMLFSYKYYSKGRFFNAFNVLLQSISTNTQFLQDDIIKVIQNHPKTSNSIYNSIIDNYIKFLKTNGKQEFAQNIDSITELSALDKEKLVLFFNDLGHTDCDTQLNNIKSLQKYISTRIEETKQDIKTKAIIIQKLSIVLGIAVFILLL